MPSIIPSYVYSLFATLIVGAILVGGITMETANIRNQAVTQQLSNLDEYVATQSMALATRAVETGQNTTLYLDIPSQVANQVYWVALVNGQSGAQVTSGLGSTAVLSDQDGVAIPAEVSVSGFYCSSDGRAFLQCSVENQTVDLTLMGV